MNFWRIVTQHHMYVIGGSSDHEHWHAPDVIAGQLSNRTCEGCVTYHMLKLTRLLHFHQQDRTDLLDYYERAPSARTRARRCHCWTPPRSGERASSR